MKKVQLTAMVHAGQVDHLNAAARRLGVSAATVVRCALAEYLSTVDAAEDETSLSELILELQDHR